MVVVIVSVTGIKNKAKIDNNRTEIRAFLIMRDGNVIGLPKIRKKASIWAI